MALLVLLAFLAYPDGTAGASLDRAEALLEQSETGKAFAVLRPLLEELQGSGDRSALSRAHQVMGWAYLQSNRYPEALDQLGRALALSREISDRPLEARVLQLASVVHKARGAYPEAQRDARAALAIHEELGDRPGSAKDWMVLGAVQDLMGEYRLALESYGKARRRLEDAKERSFFTLLNETAITHKNLGHYEEALALYRQALEEQRRRGDRYGQAVTLSNMGVVYLELGEPGRAAELLGESLALCHELGERRGESFVLGNLAEASEMRGDRGRAEQFLERELAVARETGNRLAQGLSLKGLGELRLAAGDRSQGREDLEAALAIFREMGAAVREASTLVALADLDLREGQADLARGRGERALALARKAGSAEVESKARLVLARAARASGDGDGALEHLRAALDVVNGLRGRVRTDAGKVAYLDARQQVFHELVDLLFARGRVAEALEVAEAARGRALSDLLAGRELKLRAAEARPLATIREAEARLRAEARRNPTDEAVLAELTRTRAATEADLGRKLRSLEVEQPELASLVVAEPVAFAEIAATARRLRATIVEYLVTERRLFAWVVGPGGQVHGSAVEVGRERLREMVGGLHRRLNELDLAALRDPAPARAALADLHRLLVSPVAGHLPRDPAEIVYIVPHDALFLVPFAALLDGRGRYLVEKHTLASSPSVAVLHYTAEKKRRALSPGKPHLLAVADPLTPVAARLSPLPGARDEVRRIGRFVPAARRTVLVGEAASEANVKRLAPGQTVLHFAVHGVLDDDRPWDSALALAPSGGEDGWLKASEIFGLDLRADLVVLGGCSTGLGRLSGDGFLGLTRAFLYAGAPSVVVSQWNVSDVVTSYLMDRFYAGLHEGLGKARALRRAELLTLERYPHPALWAVFSLVGEPD